MKSIASSQAWIVPAMSEKQTNRFDKLMNQLPTRDMQVQLVNILNAAFEAGYKSGVKDSDPYETSTSAASSLPDLEMDIDVDIRDVDNTSLDQMQVSQWGNTNSS